MSKDSKEASRVGRRGEAFRHAFKASVPIMAGYGFLGATYGIYMHALGFGVLCPLLMALTVYAGSAEFLLGNMLLGSFHPLQTFLMVLMVNARHLFYGLAMLDRYKGFGWKKFFLIFGLTDETFAIVSSTKEPEGVDRGWYLLWLTWLDEAYWVAGTALGALLGPLLTLDLRGLDFVLTAMFTAIFADCELREIPIGAAVRQHFADIGHDPEKLDVVYENAQARERTQILMDLANELGGIVIGTGDLSEIALGWSTYNGDHMSMYCVNCGIPKSLVRYMVEYRAAAASSAALAQILRDVNDTPVSPELLPGGNQHTESILGSYDLHDFFLYYFLRYAEGRENLRILAQKAFGDKFTAEQVEAALRLFMRRFFSQQFKRNCMPDGPKVGTVALSPRGDWRMPSDAAQTLWE